MDFPPEIIKCVLRHLSLEDLKKCLLVSHDIRELIIKTPELMRKFDVILFHETWKQKMPFIKKYGYFIRSLKFNDVGFDDENQFKRILNCTPNLERLTFSDCYIITPEDNEVVNQNNDENDQNLENQNDNVAADDNQNNVDENLPDNQIIAVDIAEQNPPEVQEAQAAAENNENRNLEENMDDANVNLENNHPENVPENPQIEMEIQNNPETVEADSTEIIESEIQLKYLSHLHLESSTIAESLVEYIKSCKRLKYFKLTFYYQEPKTEFTKFICQQDDLEELILQGYSDMVFKSIFHVDINEMIKFRLKNLSLECELCYHRNFSNFFRAQAEHIKDLTISCYNIDFHYYRILFSSFKKLEKLVLPTDWILNDSRTQVIKDYRLDSIKDLELVGSNDDLEIFKTFINIFPNVLKLKCENLSNFSLQGILENFKSLSTIHVYNFRCDTMLFVRMPALKTFNIEFLCASGHNFFWEKLTQDCPNIEHLLIDDIGNFKLNASIKVEFRIIIQNLKNLKELKTCQISCSPHDNSLNPDEDANVNDRNNDDSPFYKMDVNLIEKTIKLSNQFASRCNEEVELLREIFKECDIVEL